MRNGEYELVKAPADYPGRTYRGARRYAYEHHIVWWQHTGELVPAGFEIHHKDENKRRNVFSNLEVKSHGAHTAHHAAERVKRRRQSGDHGRWRCRCKDCRRMRADVMNEWRWRTGRREKRA